MKSVGNIFSPRQVVFSSALLLCLGVAFQLLVTLPLGKSGIRVASSDLIFPVMLAFALYQWAFLEGWPKWRMKALPWFLLGLTVWMLISTVIGILFTGQLMPWAIVNKLIGWFILVGYLLLGVWLAQRTSDETAKLFVKILVCTALLIGLTDIWPYVQSLRGLGTYFRVEGVAGNPNAYGYLVAIILVVALPFMHKGQLLGRKMDLIVLSLLIMFIVLSGSRSAWVGLFLGLVALLAIKRLPFSLFFRSVIVSAAMMGALVAIPHVERVVVNTLETENHTQTKIYKPYIARTNIMNDSGVSHRMQITTDAIELWMEHPVAGVGLGGFLWSQRQNGHTSTIHNTILWLLTEVGVIGVLLFGTFFAAAVFVLWKDNKESELDPLTIGSFASLFVFLGASVGMEAMYQRHLWFLAGFALVLRVKPQSSSV